MRCAGAESMFIVARETFSRVRGDVLAPKGDVPPITDILVAREVERVLLGQGIACAVWRGEERMSGLNTRLVDWKGAA